MAGAAVNLFHPYFPCSWEDIDLRTNRELVLTVMNETDPFSPLDGDPDSDSIEILNENTLLTELDTQRKESRCILF